MLNGYDLEQVAFDVISLVRCVQDEN